MAESLLLKWGTLKAWELERDEPCAIMRKYLDLGASYGVMAQRDTPEQKQLICDLIDALDGTIENDWEGTIMSKDEAKAYVMNYGTKKKVSA